MYRDICKKEYRVKKINLMNEDGIAYEFHHRKGSNRVVIIRFDYNKDTYGQHKECRVVVSRNIANKFYYKVVGDGYRLNTTYVA